MFGRKALPEPVSDLAMFLVERITEDEDAIRADPARFPARALAKCEAERRIMFRCQNMPDGWAILTRLAWPYADHPDYREAWRP